MSLTPTTTFNLSSARSILAKYSNNNSDSVITTPRSRNQNNSKTQLRAQNNNHDDNSNYSKNGTYRRFLREKESNTNNHISFGDWNFLCSIISIFYRQNNQQESSSSPLTITPLSLLLASNYPLSSICCATSLTLSEASEILACAFNYESNNNNTNNNTLDILQSLPWDLSCVILTPESCCVQTAGITCVPEDALEEEICSTILSSSILLYHNRKENYLGAIVDFYLVDSDKKNKQQQGKKKLVVAKISSSTLEFVTLDFHSTVKRDYHNLSNVLMKVSKNDHRVQNSNHQHSSGSSGASRSIPSNNLFTSQFRALDFHPKIEQQFPLDGFVLSTGASMSCSTEEFIAAAAATVANNNNNQHRKFHFFSLPTQQLTRTNLEEIFFYTDSPFQQQHQQHQHQYDTATRIYALLDEISAFGNRRLYGTLITNNSDNDNKTQLTSCSWVKVLTRFERRPDPKLYFSSSNSSCNSWSTTDLDKCCWVTSDDDENNNNNGYIKSIVIVTNKQSEIDFLQNNSNKKICVKQHNINERSISRLFLSYNNNNNTHQQSFLQHHTAIGYILGQKLFPSSSQQQILTNNNTNRMQSSLPLPNLASCLASSRTNSSSAISVEALSLLVEDVLYNMRKLGTEVEVKSVYYNHKDEEGECTEDDEELTSTSAITLKSPKELMSLLRSNQLSFSHDEIIEGRKEKDSALLLLRRESSDIAVFQRCIEVVEEEENDDAEVIVEDKKKNKQEAAKAEVKEEVKSPTTFFEFMTMTVDGKKKSFWCMTLAELVELVFAGHHTENGFVLIRKHNNTASRTTTTSVTPPQRYHRIDVINSASARTNAPFFPRSSSSSTSTSLLSTGQQKQSIVLHQQLFTLSIAFSQFTCNDGNDQQEQQQSKRNYSVSPEYLYSCCAAIGTTTNSIINQQQIHVPLLVAVANYYLEHNYKETAGNTTCDIHAVQKNVTRENISGIMQSCFDNQNNNEGTSSSSSHSSVCMFVFDKKSLFVKDDDYTGEEEDNKTKNNNNSSREYGCALLEGFDAASNTLHLVDLTRCYNLSSTTTNRMCRGRRFTVSTNRMIRAGRAGFHGGDRKDLSFPVLVLESK